MNKKVGITLKGVKLDNITPNIDENMMKELLNNRELYLDFMRDFNPNIETVANLTRERDALKYLLQKYKDLEEQGLLLRLPCKVGSAIYVIDGDEGGDWIDKYEVKHFCISSRGVNIIYCTCGTMAKNFRPKDIGKKAFLTRKEAEQKLKEMEE